MWRIHDFLPDKHREAATVKVFNNIQRQFFLVFSFINSFSVIKLIHLKFLVLPPNPTVPAVALHKGNQSPNRATSLKILVAWAKFYMPRATGHLLVSSPVYTSERCTSKIIVWIGQHFHPLTFCRMNYGVAFFACFHRQLHFREALKKESTQSSLGSMKKC